MEADPEIKKPRALPTAMRALRHRNYQLFFAGQLVSLIGTWMQNLAQSWLVYRITGSPIHLGSVAFCGQIPVLLLGPFGGMVADRYNRRYIVIATQTASMLLAFALAALTLTHLVQVWEIYVIALLLGSVNSFDIAARQSFIVEMVEREDLSNAIAVNSSMFNGARIIGPAIAGFVIKRVGEGWCFFGNGLSYIAVIAGLLLMRMTSRDIPPRSGSALAHIAEGFRFVATTKPIRALLSFIGVVSLIGMPYAVLMPIFAKNILHGDASTQGYLMGSAGIGALCGAMLLATREGPHGLGRWIALSAGGFGVSLILFAQSRQIILSEILLFPVGFCMMIQMASTNTLIQSMVPDNLRGRVMSVYSMTFMGMAPVGALLAGILTKHLGAPGTVALSGAICIVGAIVFAIQLPGLRPEASELLRIQESIGRTEKVIVSEGLAAEVAERTE